MKVEIAKEEYRNLLDLLHIASWVLIAHKSEVDLRIDKYDKIIQKFYALAREMGFADLIEFNASKGKYHPTRTFEDMSHFWEFIDEFVDHSFWDELIIRLTDRDAARRVGSYEDLERLSHQDRHELEGPIEEKYAEEFNKNGLDNVAIIEQFGPVASKPVTTHD